MDGALVLDKPQGVTSHAAVVAARRLLSEGRIGHLGTLDPFATGVLVLLVGHATRLARFYRDRDKTYRGTIRFGYSTDTFDLTGTPTSPEQTPALEEAELRRLFRDFEGTQQQQPPAFSAKKVGGVPAYRLARKGRAVQLAPATVTIHILELGGIEGPLVRFQARVSSGTYIRSLVHDLGQRIGVGAHLAELRRTAVGEFTEAAAIPLDELEQKVREGLSALIALESLLPEFPVLSLPASAIGRVLHGNEVEVESEAAWVKLLDASGKLCAVAKLISRNLYHPAVVFPFSGK